MHGYPVSVSWSPSVELFDQVLRSPRLVTGHCGGNNAVSGAVHGVVPCIGAARPRGVWDARRARVGCPVIRSAAAIRARDAASSRT